MSCFGGVHGGMVSIITYGMYMVWYVMECYVSKHKQKDNLGTSGSVWERFEAFRNRLNAFQTFWVLMRAFVRLGRLGSIIPYVCMAYE